MLPSSFADLAEQVLDRCRRAGLKVATAESCTGGMIAATLTEIPGSSEVLERGFVVYSNAAKYELLGVPQQTIERYGAVSAEVAAGMVEGALARSPADIAVAVTGIAGPGGATAGKPVGLVFLAVGKRGGAPQIERHHYSGDRQEVRIASTRRALELIDQAARL